MISLFKTLSEIKITNKPIKNKYTKYNDGSYLIDKDKALEYLKQFNNDEVGAEIFIMDDEGLSESECNGLEDPEKMTNEEMEDFLRIEMSYYFFSKPDEIN